MIGVERQCRNCPDDNNVNMQSDLRVNDVDSAILPSACSGGGCDSNATLLLLFHPVHCGCALVDFSNFVSFASVVQDSLGCGGFASVDVSHDTDVSVLRKRHSATLADLRNVINGVTGGGEDFGCSLFSHFN